MRGLARYNNRVGSLFPEVDDFFRSFTNLYDATSRTMPIEMYEENSSLHLNVDVPGFKPDDIEVRVFDDRVQISSKSESEEGEKPSSGEESSRSYYYRRERKDINYRIGLPTEVDSDNVSAKFENGVLRLTMPKKKKEEGKVVEIGQ